MTKKETFEELRRDMITKSEAYNKAISGLTFEQCIHAEAYAEISRLRLLASQSTMSLSTFILGSLKTKR